MTQIGKYEIVRRTGETPLGTVYEAFDPVMRRTVSIQAPGDEERRDELPRRQTSELALQKGGESLGRLNHPNIRNIIAAEEADGTLYLVMEPAHASAISDRIAGDGLPPNEALAFLKMAALALDHAHGQGVMHPGLTPAHLLVDESGVLKVAGFEMSGLQAIPEEEMTQADVDLLMNSLPYRAPEFLAGEAVDSRADQFSLAAIAFELFSGRVLFNQSSPLSVMAANMAGFPPDLRLLDIRLPSTARRVLERALASDRTARYSSCSAMVEVLEAAVLQKATAATRMTPAPSTTGPRTTGGLREGTGSSRISEQLAHVRRRSSRRIRLVVAVASVAIAAMIAFILFESRPPVTSPNPAATTSIPPAPAPAGDSALSKQQLDNLVNTTVQHATTARASGATGQDASRVSKPKKQKREKSAPDLDMGDVHVGR